MSFTERGREETLASHLLRNAIALQLTVGQRRRLTAAYRLGLGTKSDQVEGRRMANEVQLELAVAVQAVAAFAEERGEKVTTFNDAGARQITDRDGVAALVKAKALTDADARTALSYRYLFEHAAAGLRSQLGAVDEGGSKRAVAGLSARSAAQLHRAYVLARLDQVERAVLADQENGLELAVLRIVAGEGRALSSVTSRGKSRGLYLDALRRALGSVAGALR